MMWVAVPRGPRGLKSVRSDRLGDHRNVAVPRGPRGLKLGWRQGVCRDRGRGPSWAAWIEIR